jgi:hypothetical protein
VTTIIDNSIHTYNEGLGWINAKATPAGPRSGNLAGQVFMWITKGGLPVMVPDQWAIPENPDVFEALPKGTRAITIDGDLVVV